MENPYESPHTPGDVQVRTPSETFERAVLAMLCFLAAIVLAFAALLAAVIAGDPKTAPSERERFYAFGLWAVLNAPTAIVMGVGILRKRPLYSTLGLTFLVISAACIALVAKS